MSEKKCCCHEEKYKNTAREDELVKQLQSRMNRMIGQMNGIKKMIEENRYCGDVLIQVAAVEKALQNFGSIVLKNHLETCVVDEIKKGNMEIVDEAVDLINKLK